MSVESRNQVVGSCFIFSDVVYLPTVGTPGSNRHKLITSCTQTKVVTASFKATRPHASSNHWPFGRK